MCHLFKLLDKITSQCLADHPVSVYIPVGVVQVIGPLLLFRSTQEGQQIQIGNSPSLAVAANSNLGFVSNVGGGVSDLL